MNKAFPFHSLSELAKDTDFPREWARYYLAHIVEIEADKFVADLCQAAYNMGVDDTLDDIEGLR